MTDINAYAALPAQEGTRAARRWPALIAACGLLVTAAAFAGVMRADRARPPVTGLDQAWLSVVARTRNAGLTGLFKVLSLIGGPVGGTVTGGGHWPASPPPRRS